MSERDGIYRCAFCGRKFDYDDFISDRLSVHEEGCALVEQAWEDLAEVLTRSFERERTGKN